MASTGFILPTLAETIDRVRGDIDSNLPGADSRLRRTALRALSLGLGGASWLLHKFGGEIAKETIVDCASETGVARWQNMFGVPDIQPQFSAGPLDFAGVDGSVIPEGVEVVRNDEVAYTIDVQSAATRTISGGVATVQATASAAGSDSDAAAGQTVTLVAPVAGVNSLAAVGTGGMVGGIDEETTEGTRSRVLDRMASPPQGGNDADFVGWVKQSVPNTREVYVSRNEPTFGHVTVRFIIEPVDGNGDPTGDPADALPTAANVQTALDFIAGTTPEDFKDGVAPVPISKPLTGTYAQPDGRIDVRLLTAQPVDFEITDLDPDTTAVRDAVEDSLKALMLARSVPGGIVKKSQWIGAIDAAPGEDSHDLTEIDGVAPADVVVGADSLLTLGTVVYLP